MNYLTLTEHERQARLDSRLKHLDSAAEAAADCLVDGQITKLLEEDSASLQKLNQAITAARAADVDTVAGLNGKKSAAGWSGIQRAYVFVGFYDDQSGSIHG